MVLEVTGVINPSLGSWNADVDEIYMFLEYEVKIYNMCWVGRVKKSFDNHISQDLAFTWTAMGYPIIKLIV